MKSFYIDDITWNDLNMEDFLERFDASSSGAGAEYIRKALRNMEFDAKLLEERSERADFFSENEASAEKLRRLFRALGRTKKYTFYDYIFRLRECESSGNALHYILIVLLLLCIGLICVRPAIGIVALVAMICVNIAVYFRKKAEIEGYFVCLKYLVSMISCAEAVLKKTDLNQEAFLKIKESLENSTKELKSLRRLSWLLTNSVSGSLADVVMDYVRMVFHVDIIRFNQMKKKAMGHEEQINALYGALGELELALSISSFRKSLPCWCSPAFSEKAGINAENVYHPLVDGAVANSLNTEKSVLFTGSNASGKSTFLKTLALNQIFAQTIYTCTGRKYDTSFGKVLSSMALSDNILGGESYFVVEIKSLKRIFDELGDTMLFCFIDEVLRGTNTKERIAASSQILKKLSSGNCLVFAATHDIELTDILKDDMANMHFSESVEGAQVLFDYKLKDGAADSRNALRLLAVYGFDSEIIENAEKMCLL